MTFEFADEMAVALENRPDIQPKVTAGNNIKMASPQKVKRNNDDVKADHTKAANNLGDDEELSPAPKKIKKVQAKKTLMTFWNSVSH